MKYQEPQTKTDQRIFAAAAALLDDVGENFTVDDLAARAQVSRATLYRRIGSKEALLQRLAATSGAARGQQDSRTRILAAARRIFGRNGLVNTTMEQVAEEAGVGVATVYRHFGDKDQLVRTFAEDIPYAAIAEAVFHASADVRADLNALLGVIVPFLQANRDILRLVLVGNQAERAYLERLRGGTERMRDRLTGYFAAQILAGRLRDTAEPHELAQALLGMLIGFIIVGNLHFDQPPAPVDRISGLIVDIFLDGLLPSPTRG